MKKSLLPLCFLFLSAVNAQNINFPDPILKGALTNSPLVGNNIALTDLNGNVTTNADTDGDGEISVTEAENIRAIDFAYLGFTNLEGLQFFTNVRKINSYNCFASSFIFPELINLEELVLQVISGQQTLTSLDVSGNINLRVLDIYGGLLNSIDLSNNINLKELRITDNGANTVLSLDNLTNLRKLTYFGSLSTLDISDCDKLVEITLGSSAGAVIPMSAIDLSNQPLLANLFIGRTQITSLDLSNNPNLENVYVSDNLLQNLNFGNIQYVRNLYCDNNQLTTLDLNNFQNLDVLSCPNNNLINLKLKNFTIEDFVNFSGNPNLQYICCDVEQQVYINNQALINGNFDTVINSDCETNSVLTTIQPDNSNNKIIAFPNPTTDILSFNSYSNIDKVTISDSNGRIVSIFQNISGAIDVSALEVGVYFLQVNANGVDQQLKLIKI